MKHMLKYHLGIPVVVLATVALLGAPLATAVGVAMMSGCVAMVVMTVGHGHGSATASRPARDVTDGG